MRPTELLPPILVDELLRLAKIDRNWVEVFPLAGDTYSAKSKLPSFVTKLWHTASDALGMLAASRWLIDGPKVFRPTKEQCQALENVDVNLSLSEYAQPYPAIYVELNYPPFVGVMCYHDPLLATGPSGPGMLICCLHSKDNEDDIVTTIRRTERPVEESLEKFDPSCQDLAATSVKALRVACNSCLALAHFGSHLDYLLPKEVERDRSFASKPGEKGEKARWRLRLAVRQLSFDHEVVLHRTETRPRKPGEPAGFRSTHWRRGHWAMVACGPRHSERRRVFRAAVLVRADLLEGDQATSSTTYVAKGG